MRQNAATGVSNKYSIHAKCSVVDLDPNFVGGDVSLSELKVKSLEDVQRVNFEDVSFVSKLSKIRQLC